MKNNNTKSKEKQPTTIQDCTLIGVSFDAKAVNAIEVIAMGLVENAKALGNLAEVLKASNVNIEALVKITGCK